MAHDLMFQQEIRLLATAAIDLRLAPASTR